MHLYKDFGALTLGQSRLMYDDHTHLQRLEHDACLN